MAGSGRRRSGICSLAGGSWWRSWRWGSGRRPPRRRSPTIPPTPGSSPSPGPSSPGVSTRWRSASSSPCWGSPASCSASWAAAGSAGSGSAPPCQPSEPRLPPMSGWTQVEVYATFIKLTGEMELRSDRLRDRVNGAARYLTLRNTRAEPLSVSYPVLSRVEPRTTIAKSAVILLCPLEEPGVDSSPGVRRRKVVHQAVFNTIAFSLVGDIHLDPSETLQQHLEANPGDFLPITNVSALWVTALSSATSAVQRPFALLNPSSILSFSDR